MTIERKIEDAKRDARSTVFLKAFTGIKSEADMITMQRFAYVAADIEKRNAEPYHKALADLLRAVSCDDDCPPACDAHGLRYSPVLTKVRMLID